MLKAACGLCETLRYVATIGTKVWTCCLLHHLKVIFAADIFAADNPSSALEGKLQNHLVQKVPWGSMASCAPGNDRSHSGTLPAGLGSNAFLGLTRSESVLHLFRNAGRHCI